MPLLAIREAARLRLGHLIDGITSDDDLALVGPGNIAQLLLMGFWKQPYRKVGPFDYSFHKLLDFLPGDSRHKLLLELWEDGCDPDDEYDAEFQSCIQTYVCAAPFLPRLRPHNHFREPEIAYWIQDEKEQVREDIIEGRTVLENGVGPRMILSTWRRLFTGHDKDWKNHAIIFGQPGTIITPRLMLPPELEYFRAQPDDRLLQLYYTNGDDTFGFDDFRRQVREGAIASLKR